MNSRKVKTEDSSDDDVFESEMPRKSKPARSSKRIPKLLKKKSPQTKCDKHVEKKIPKLTPVTRRSIIAKKAAMKATDGAAENSAGESTTSTKTKNNVDDVDDKLSDISISECFSPAMNADDFCLITHLDEDGAPFDDLEKELAMMEGGPANKDVVTVASPARNDPQIKDETPISSPNSDMTAAMETVRADELLKSESQSSDQNENAAQGNNCEDNADANSEEDEDFFHFGFSENEINVSDGGGVSNECNSDDNCSEPTRENVDDDDVLSIFGDDDKLFGNEKIDTASTSSGRIPKWKKTKQAQPDVTSSPKVVENQQKTNVQQRNSTVQPKSIIKPPSSTQSTVFKIPIKKASAKPLTNIKNSMPPITERPQFQQKDPRKVKFSLPKHQNEAPKKRNHSPVPHRDEDERPRKMIKIQNTQKASVLVQTSLTCDSEKSATALVLPTFIRDPISSKPAFDVLFSDVCRASMNNDCKGDCHLNHRLPDNECFNKLLNQLKQQDVIQTYNVFILRLDKLFLQYFKNFCNYFGNNALEKELIQMVHDCEDRRSYAFLDNIVNNFIKAGNSYSSTLRKVISAIRFHTTQASNTILKLVLDPDNDNIVPFMGILEQLSSQEKYVFPFECINLLMTLYLEKKTHELFIITWRILNKLEPSEKAKLDKELFETVFSVFKQSQS